jgi:hypothetical protein
MNDMQTVGQLLQEHVALEVESSDRVYRNVDVPELQRWWAWSAASESNTGPNGVSSRSAAPACLPSVAPSSPTPKPRSRPSWRVDGAWMRGPQPSIRVAA